MSRPLHQSGSAGEDVSIAGKRLGKYVVSDLLGRGGMGVVYEGVDTVLHRRVAIKVLKPTIAEDAGALQRFVREARAAARLNDPHVVAVYDCAEQDGLHFIVMELVRGGNLHEELQRSGRLGWQDATAVILDACRGLVSAHRAGLVHRDIKPSNLLRARNGSVKLADFGLSKTAQTPGVTAVDVVVGTPDYMSPEQCRGETADPQSDVYSLGATYFALLTGRPPYEHESALRILYAHCSQPVPDPRNVVPGLPDCCSDIVRRAMAKEPSQRYASAAVLQQALESALAEVDPATGRSTSPRPNETVTFRNADTPCPPDSTASNRPRFVWAASPRGLTVALVIGGVLLTGGALLPWLLPGLLGSRSTDGKSSAAQVRPAASGRSVRRGNSPVKPAVAKPGSGAVPGMRPGAQFPTVTDPADRVGSFLIPGMEADRKAKNVLVKRRTVKVGLAVTAVAMSSRGDRLAVSEYRLDAGSEVHVWNAQGQKTAQRHVQHMVLGMAFRPETDELAIACARGGGVVLWNPEHETSIEFPVANPSAMAGALAFSSDGARLAYGMNSDKKEGLVELWNVPEHKRLWALNRFKGIVTGIGFTAGTTGEPLLIGSDSTGQLIQWNAGTGAYIRTWKASGAISGLSISSDGQRLAAATARGLEVWNLARPTDAPQRPSNSATAVRQVAFLPGTQQLVWTADQEVLAFSGEASAAPLMLGPTDDLPLGMAASPTGWLVAVASRGGVLSLWEFPRTGPWAR